jgi:hypothetical protein
MIVVGLASIFVGAPVHAASSTLVIAQIQAGAVSTETAAATQEFISLYNNSTQDIDVTGWCLTNKTGLSFVCVTPVTSGQRLFLASHQYMVVASDSFAARHTSIVPDVIYPTTNAMSGSLIGSSDTVTVKDTAGVAVDSFTWTASLAGGTVYQRVAASDLVSLVDTDTTADFVKLQGVVVPASGTYEVVTIVDQCSNLETVQTIIPVGYFQDSEGNCFQDACVNLDGPQLAVPEEYVDRGAGECVYDYSLLQITELLPNVAGADVGHEFIELYNPTARMVALGNYQLKVGSKLYDFPAGSSIGPGEYKAFYNSEIAFTLTNTTVTVTLVGDDGSVIDQPVAYNNPDEDMAWALIDGTWQYTNQPTPATENLASTVDVHVIEETVPKQLAPCAPNQYRSPETNRCRLLVTATSTLTPCKDGQYRSEETNRCRTIALAGGTLTPCREDQYRSEETNRCRNLATAAKALTPCKDNQYRSEETNRCRTIAATTPPPAAFAVEPIKDTGKVFAGWWALGGVMAMAVGYGVWEWRREITAGVQKVATFFTFYK